MSYTLNKRGAQIDAIFLRAEAGGTIDGAIALKAPLASPALTGTPTAPTAAAGTDTTQIATTEFVTDAVQTAGAGLTELIQAGQIVESIAAASEVSFTDGAPIEPRQLVISIASAASSAKIYRTDGTDLLAGKTWTDGSYYNDSGEVTPNASLKRMSTYLPVVGGAPYFLECANNGTYRIRIHEYDADRNWLRQIYSATGNLATWTASDDAAYIRMSLGKAATDIICYRGEIFTVDWSGTVGSISDGVLTYNGGTSWTLTTGGIDYALTGDQIVLLRGTNGIWSTAGDTAIEYAADPKIYIDEQIAALQALVLENNG